MDLSIINSFFRQRTGVLLSLCVITPLSFWLWRYYDGPWRVWVRFYVTGVFYEIFWCLALFFFWPRKQTAVKIAAVVFVVTCILEALQLWEAPFLERIRSTVLGMAILGTCFVWWQFPYYALGSLIGLIWMRILGKKLIARCD